jgi:hypothetical protein
MNNKFVAAIENQNSTNDGVEILNGREYYASSNVAYILPKDTDGKSLKSVTTLISTCS